MENSSPKKLSADCWPTVGRQSADSRLFFFTFTHYFLSWAYSWYSWLFVEGAIGLFVVPRDVHWYIQYHYSIYNNSINSYLQYILAVISFWFYCGTTGSQSLPWIQIKLLKYDNFSQQSADGLRFGQCEGTETDSCLLKLLISWKLNWSKKKRKKKQKSAEGPMKGILLSHFLSAFFHVYQ